MTDTRREFLKQVGAAGLVSMAATPPLFLQRAALADTESGSQRDDRILVVVQMAGGNDGLNTVIPYANDDYYKARPSLAVDKGSVLKLNDQLGLHPTMKGFKELYDEGMLSVIQGVGYKNPNRSHFRSMDIWQSARPDIEYTEDGWLGRALDLTAEKYQGGVPALAFGRDKLPLSLVATKVNVPTIRNLDSYQLQLGPGPDSHKKLHRRIIGKLADQTASAGSDLDFLRKTTVTAFTSADRLKKVRSSYKPSVDYPNNGLAQQLKVLAQIIAGDFGTRIFFVTLGGFDTHSEQADAHQGLLNELSSALHAFYMDLKGHKLHERVLVATFSEFGRRVKENGSLGTDHGAASQMFVIGAKGKPGIHGDHPSLTSLFQGDLKFHTDFRQVYATLLDNWLKVPSPKVLGQEFKKLNFI